MPASEASGARSAPVVTRLGPNHPQSEGPRNRLSQTASSCDLADFGVLKRSHLSTNLVRVVATMRNKFVDNALFEILYGGFLINGTLQMAIWRLRRLPDLGNFKVSGGFAASLT